MESNSNANYGRLRCDIRQFSQELVRFCFVFHFSSPVSRGVFQLLLALLKQNEWRLQQQRLLGGTNLKLSAFSQTSNSNSKRPNEMTLQFDAKLQMFFLLLRKRTAVPKMLQLFLDILKAPPILRKAVQILKFNSATRPKEKANFKIYALHK